MSAVGRTRQFFRLWRPQDTIFRVTFGLLATFGDGFKRYVIYRAYLDTLWAARGHALSLLSWPTLATPPLRASELAHAGELPGSAEIVGPTRSGDGEDRDAHGQTSGA